MSSSSATARSVTSGPIETLFRPQSIAVVGASANPQSQGYEFVQALVEMGFPGPIYPVNPKLGELLGRKAYPRLEAIPGPVDFVISAVPAVATLELVESASAKGTRLIHLFTARFSETGRDDAVALERELRSRVKKSGIRVIGPNCMGVYYPKAKLTFDPGLPAEPGAVGFLTQSGSHAFRVIRRGKERGLRFSKVISYGNALDLDEADFLDHFAQDPDTKVIAAYVEGIHDGRRFFSALRHATASKPVIILKGGRSVAGHAAASSHTAALAGEMQVWRGAVGQAGAIEVRTINELVDMLVAFEFAGPAAGNRVAVLGGAGGETVESADLCNEAGLDLPLPPDDIRRELRGDDGRQPCLRRDHRQREGDRARPGAGRRRGALPRDPGPRPTVGEGQWQGCDARAGGAGIERGVALEGGHPGSGNAGRGRRGDLPRHGQGHPCHGTLSALRRSVAGRGVGAPSGAGTADWREPGE
jgi:acyl-CoA synthetase (NDP forming)